MAVRAVATCKYGWLRVCTIMRFHSGSTMLQWAACMHTMSCIYIVYVMYIGATSETHSQVLVYIIPVYCFHSN